VGGAAPPDQPDQGWIRDLLTAAQGFAVFGSDRKRIGTFIELAGTDGDEIAIRADGLFLWHRRVLPLAAVADVFPKQRAVVLSLDRRSLARPVGQWTEAADSARDPSQEMQERMERYLSPLARETDEARHLAFVSTVEGYALIELQGPPPPVGTNVDLPNRRGSFRVAKVGVSPLPNDPRVCAYVEPAAP
jgi:hypothetical protein